MQIELNRFFASERDQEEEEEEEGYIKQQTAQKQRRDALAACNNFSILCDGEKRKKEQLQDDGR